MKTTKTYLSGCTWCGATGYVKDITPYVTGTWKNICPVCQGAKTMPVTETFEDEPEDQLKGVNSYEPGAAKKIMMTSDEYYGLNEKVI